MNQSPNDFSIADAMINYRIREDVSQTDFAFDIGISQPSISHYEEGKRYPSKKIMKKICDYIGVPIPIKEGKSVLSSVITKVKKLPEDRLLLVLDFINKKFGDIVNCE